jgi:tRNA-modifying protein YgfZ
MTRIAALPERRVITIAGEERVAFLQGLVSNDVAAVAPGNAIWAALLSPQGKWLADFFILTDGQLLLLDAERAHLPSLTQRLARFRLRSKVSIDVAAERSVYTAWDGRPAIDAIAAPDPRLPQAGWRLIASSPVPTNATAAEWDMHRLSLGLPDGSRDLESDKTILLEAGFDELNGVSWSKGCYMGQELTARTKYRGLIKRRLVPVDVDGPLPPPGTPVRRDEIEVGTMRSGCERLGLAVLRLDALNAALTCGDARLTPRIPAWLRLADSADGA